MTDCLCESCLYFYVGWDMHSECEKHVVGMDDYRSCSEGCSKYEYVTQGSEARQ